MTSALSITRSAGAPRAAFVDFPLGHTTGKPHQPEMQRALLLEALAGFQEIREPGGVKQLPFRWDDDDWKLDPMGGQGGGTGSGDARSERLPDPQYQSAADRDAAEARHRAGPCGACVGAD
jgi:hypothetical protein